MICGCCSLCVQQPFLQSSGILRIGRLQQKQEKDDTMKRLLSDVWQLLQKNWISLLIFEIFTGSF